MYFKRVLLTLGLLVLMSASFAKDHVTISSSNVLVINEPFRGSTVSKIMQEAINLDANLKSTDPIILFIDSPGGSIQAGLELITFLNGLNRPVITLCNFCASMGFQTIQGVKGKRYILPFGTMMSHKARGYFYGEFPGQIDSRYVYYLKRLEELDKITVSRTGKKHTLKSYRDLYENEYWCDGAECVNQGFSDGVVEAKCDLTLKGTKTVSKSFPFRGRVVTFEHLYSQCPLNTYPLSYKIYVDGRLIFSSNSSETENQFVEISETDLTELKNEAVKGKLEHKNVIKGY